MALGEDVADGPVGPCTEDSSGPQIERHLRDRQVMGWGDAGGARTVMKVGEATGQSGIQQKSHGGSAEEPVADGEKKQERK